ncbi:MAG: rhodanese-like domain-containing protein [Campylobacterales bacterium]|nr:rhodanese-like domain-containing protein [Campylobacterales bacterium]
MEEIKKVDPESAEFKEEFEKTSAFTDKVLKQFEYVYHPDTEIVTSIRNGLTRNKLIYGKRYCPCFFVTGKKEEDRVCPCQPALKEEIPNEGRCHCGIFCTPEFAKLQVDSETAEEAAHQHSRGLTKDECNAILANEQLDSDEIESLLEARELGMVEFEIVDVREWMEYQSMRIKGVDHLIPTTSFYESVEKLKGKEDLPLIVYCHVGSRSAYCQKVLKDMGFNKVGNLTRGIVSYRGELDRG